MLILFLYNSINDTGVSYHTYSLIAMSIAGQPAPTYLIHLWSQYLPTYKKFSFNNFNKKYYSLMKVYELSIKKNPTSIVLEDTRLTLPGKISQMNIYSLGKNFL